MWWESSGREALGRGRIRRSERRENGMRQRQMVVHMERREP